MADATAVSPGAPLGVDVAGLRAEAAAVMGRAVELRRAVHAEPEVGLVLPRTQERVVAALAGLGLAVSVGTRISSVVAVLEGDRPGPTTLLRADMDALAMPEDTGLPFASRVDGVMHACGHDAHVGMLVGAAHVLAARRGVLPGRVVLMFQPGEEGLAGAQVMIEEGLLDRSGPIDRAFALHISSVWESGSILTRPGALMASADSFRLVITGRGGHASMPHDALDPIPVACEVVGAFQSMVTRRLPAFDPGVVTVARVWAGTTSNVIPEEAVLEGTVRAVSEPTRAEARAGVERVAHHVAAAHGCQARLEWTEKPYPVTINDAGAADAALALAAGLVGAGRARLMPSPLMGAEDWSYVLARVPGCMAFLGAAPPGVDHPAPNHSNRMVIDESAMVAGIAMYAAVALAGPPS